jgi:nicotinate phosphoribosyltransferase
MREGRRIAPSPPLAESRALAARELDRLPEALRVLEPKTTYRVDLSGALDKLAAEVDRRLARTPDQPHA